MSTMTTMSAKSIGTLSFDYIEPIIAETTSFGIMSVEETSLDISAASTSATETASVNNSPYFVDTLTT